MKNGHIEHKNAQNMLSIAQTLLEDLEKSPKTISASSRKWSIWTERRQCERVI